MPLKFLVDRSSTRLPSVYPTQKVMKNPVTSNAAVKKFQRLAVDISAPQAYTSANATWAGEEVDGSLGNSKVKVLGGGNNGSLGTDEIDTVLGC